MRIAFPTVYFLPAFFPRRFSAALFRVNPVWVVCVCFVSWPSVLVVGGRTVVRERKRKNAAPAFPGESVSGDHIVSRAAALSSLEVLWWWLWLLLWLKGCARLRLATCQARLPGSPDSRLESVSWCQARRTAVEQFHATQLWQRVRDGVNLSLANGGRPAQHIGREGHGGGWFDSAHLCDSLSWHLLLTVNVIFRSFFCAKS